MVRHIGHDVPNPLSLGGALRPVNRLRDVQSGALQKLRDPETVELQPDVFPGLVEVRHIGADLAGADQKAKRNRKISGLFFPRFLCIMGKQNTAPAPAGKADTKEVDFYGQTQRPGKARHRPGEERGKTGLRPWHRPGGRRSG